MWIRKYIPKISQILNGIYYRSYDTSDTLLSVSFSVTIDKLAIELRVIFNFRNERNSSQVLWAVPMKGITFLAHLSTAHLPSGRRWWELRCKIPSFSNLGDLSVKELNGAERSLMKCVEKEEFCRGICVKISADYFSS
ncbi:hypothetical protein CEXT_355181 [Caerostris extrusa]|uniref:Uncharacterized protein n=1 Tax=Caerostris extrusa TaxID=172846 RepID=A0AAV4MIE5_CAEEX|nr:hypothetical protein CEXT_355181 [Caerostris extrusa]